MTISLVISTYNRPDALNLSIKSALNQTRLPDEIIIADDGSGPQTAQLVEKFIKSSPVRIVHVWQEDKGFRLAAIRNKAVMASSCEYIIQIDGDIILHRKFVEDHERMARKGCFLRGGRVLLGRALTTRLCSSRELTGIYFWTKGLDSKIFNTLRIQWLAKFLSPRYHRKSYVLGCNMSFWKNDFMAVNGYDENYEGWGLEDSDFFGRLKRNGIQNLRLKFASLAYHLWHSENKDEGYSRNLDYYNRENIPVVCKNGADKHKNMTNTNNPID